MEKFNKSQILKLFLIAVLLVVAPLLSTSMRPAYLYFVVNLLIVSLGVEAGLLSFFSKAAENRKPIITPSSEASAEVDKERTVNSMNGNECAQNNKANAIDKCSVSEKIVGVVKVHNKVRKCPSTPSIFFIGGNETEAELQVDDEEEETGGLSGQELFTKAETFIRNFYMQLKMQKEESWNKIHGLYQKTF